LEYVALIGYAIVDKGLHLVLCVLDTLVIY